MTAEASPYPFDRRRKRLVVERRAIAQRAGLPLSAFEDLHAVDAIFVNHAHSDYLEFVLELGLPGAILIITFIGWWAWRTVAIWRDRDSGVLPRAATISSAVILAHSLVDYPARTAAILAVMVACCAIMARPGRIPPPPPLAEEDAAPARHLAA